jgi:hypothetical protein
MEPWDFDIALPLGYSLWTMASRVFLWATIDTLYLIHYINTLHIVQKEVVKAILRLTVLSLNDVPVGLNLHLVCVGVLG